MSSTIVLIVKNSSSYKFFLSISGTYIHSKFRYYVLCVFGMLYEKVVKHKKHTYNTVHITLLYRWDYRT